MSPQTSKTNESSTSSFVMCAASRPIDLMNVPSRSSGGVLIVGCENWNQPPETDTVHGDDTAKTDFGLTKLPIWSRAASDPKAAPGFYSKAAGSYDTRDLPGDASTDRFEVPPVKISWEGADLAHPGRRRD